VMAPTERQGALAAWSERFARASSTPAAFAIRELPFTTQVNLRGNAADPAFATAVHSATGCDVPVAANTYTRQGDRAALWLGPDEWLVVDRPDHGDDIAASLRSALSGTRKSVTDVSAARTVIEISGADARVVLAKGCPLDVHAGAFAPPQCAQTLLAKARVLIQCTEATPTYRLFVLGSFAAYLAEWLTDAAAECAATRTAGMEDIAGRLA
jgi:sarcosine oxidase subunit gamma